MEKINTSIMDHQAKRFHDQVKTDHMAYVEGMEAIDSGIMDEVIATMEDYDYTAYTPTDVRRALSHSRRSLEDFKALLSPAAAPLLEEMAQPPSKNPALLWKFGQSVHPPLHRQLL